MSAKAKARGGNQGGVFAVELCAARVKVCLGEMHGYSWEIFSHSRNPTGSKTKRLRDALTMAVCGFLRTVCSFHWTACSFHSTDGGSSIT